MPTAWERRQRLREVAVESAGVLCRARLRELGVDRNVVAREVAADRWRLHGEQTVAMHTGELSPDAEMWRSVWEVGRGAVLDGVSALQAAGLTGFTSDLVHVSIHHDQHAPQVDGVRVHQVRDLVASDSRGRPPRVRPAVAAVRAAQWAASPRQAALILCMVVQQRLVRPGDLVSVRWPGAHDGRTEFVRQIIADVTNGAQSLGELDFAGLCRERGLPEPEHQVVRRTRSGRIYLDVRWLELHLVVEVDGSQHRQGLAVSDDNLRRNEVTLGDDRVLTIDLVGLRLMMDAFMDQVERAVRVQSRRMGN